MNIHEAKNKVATDNGYKSWDHMLSHRLFRKEEVEELMDEAFDLYAKSMPKNPQYERITFLDWIRVGFALTLLMALMYMLFSCAPVQSVKPRYDKYGSEPKIK